MSGSHNMMLANPMSQATITINNDIITIDDITSGGPAIQTASYIILASGSIIFMGNSLEYDVDYFGTENGTNWIDPTSQAFNYQVRATVITGNTPTGTINTWLTCSTDIGWGLSLSGVGNKYTQLLIEIRDSLTQTIRDTANIEISLQIQT